VQSSVSRVISLVSSIIPSLPSLQRSAHHRCLPAAMVWPVEKVKGWKQDIDCLAAMWLRGVQGKSHKERLEFFYGPQAHACEFVISLRFPGPVVWMSPGERGGRLLEARGLLEFVLFIVSESLSFQA
jgi:hypothetical protein